MPGRSAADNVSTIPPVVLALRLAVVLIIALRIAALAIDGQRVWGFDFLRDLAIGPIILLTLLPLLAVLPQMAGAVDRWARKDAAFWPRLSWGVVLSLVAVVAVFPMSTFYYGDGGPLISEIYKIGAQERYTSEMVLNLHSAPLAGVLLHLLTTLIPAAMHTLGLPLPETTLFPFLALGIIGALVLGALLHIETNAKQRLPILLLLLGSGSILLFFGYAELYLPVVLAVAAYLLAASAALRGERPVWLPVVFFLAAVAAHYMTLSLLPSLLFLLFRRHAMVRRLTESGRTLALVFAGMLAASFALYFVLGFAHSDSRVIMPLLPVETEAGTLSYTLLSSYHLFDIANLLLLIGAVPLALLLLEGTTGRKRRSRTNTAARGKAAVAEVPERGSGTDGKRDALSFQLIAGFSFLLFLFFANISLGLARDWDIATPLGVMLVMIYVEFRRHRSAGSGEDATSGLLQAGVVSVLLVLPWIAVNVNVESSTSRFARIMTLDDEHMYGDYALSGYEALRKHAAHAKDFVREGEILMRMIEVVGYTEQYRMLVVNAIYFAEKEPSRYFGLHDWMLGRLGTKAEELRATRAEQDYAIGLKQIDSLAAVMAIESVTYQHWREMRPRIESFAARSGCSTAARILTGAVLYGQQQYAEGIPLFEAVRAADFRDPRVDGMYATCLYVGGDRERGNSEFEQGLRRHGDNPQYLFMVATAYLQRDGRFDEARALLERALTLDPPEDARGQILGLLGELRAYVESTNRATGEGTR